MDHVKLSIFDMNDTSTPVGPANLPWLGVLRAHGTDAVGFLHGQLSADLHALDEGAATFACLCNAKGGVLALLRVQRQGDGFDLVGHRALLPSVHAHLERFRLRAQVEFSLDERDGVTAEGKGGSPRYHVGAANDARATGHGADAWKAAELAAGVCWLDEASSGAFLPQMLGFDALGAINFRKGCYPGQEVIARARYLGRIKRHPWVIDIDSAPDIEPMQATKLQTGDGETDAVIVDHAPLVDGGLRLFCVARAAPGTEVSAIELGGRSSDVASAAPPRAAQGSPST